jgi:hypothetical protein
LIFWETKFHCSPTLKVVLPETLPEVAVMVVIPAVKFVVTRPLLSIDAADELDELQATCVVISLVVPSE